DPDQMAPARAEWPPHSAPTQAGFALPAWPCCSRCQSEFSEVVTLPLSPNLTRPLWQVLANSQRTGSELGALLHGSHVRDFSFLPSGLGPRSEHRAGQEGHLQYR